MGCHTPRCFAYTTPPELRGAGGRVYPVVIVGAGPVGLAAAIDLALHGIHCIVLDDNDVVSIGSRAICWSKRTLEIFDRLGVGERMLAKGVTWQVGRVYHRDQELYCFNLLPERGHKMPAFINLQQYYVEEYLVERAAELEGLIELRWKNRFLGLELRDESVAVEVDTPDGPYRLETRWLLAADGARSAVRNALGLEFKGEEFEEKFLIADVRTATDYPSDRRFWFQPTFDPSESVLVHRQPDDVFRIDFQLGWDADVDAEREPARVSERVHHVLGREARLEVQWCSIYTFRCARLGRFVHGRVLFAGDSAHVVSPFGARGGNGGIQDVDNLCWKLALVAQGRAPRALLESYNLERVHGSDENIRHSRRTTRFMTPKTVAERQLRDAVLALARDFPFARTLVNSGRLSRPCSLECFAGTVASGNGVAGPMAPGMPCTDAPVMFSGQRSGWLLEALGGDFTIVTFAVHAADAARRQAELRAGGVRLPLRVIVPAAAAGTAENMESVLCDVQGLAGERYGGGPGVTYLIRPDQHVAARFAIFDPAVLAAAHASTIAWSSQCQT